MATVRIQKDRYVADAVYQWDKNQTLQIYGLSLASNPEIHFSNATLTEALVKNATMDAAGVISAEIPNVLLQKPHKITAHICVIEGETFRSLCKVEIPVKARPKPSDYTYEDDETGGNSKISATVTDGVLVVTTV